MDENGVNDLISRRFAMKRFLWVLLVLISISVAGPSFADYTWTASGTVTGGVVADNTTTTITLDVRVGEITYLHVPTIDSAAIAVSGSYDGTNYYTIASNYSATALIDFTYAATTGGKLLKMPDLRPLRKLKITCGAAQASDRVFTLVGK
jgi:hypothetical protein